MTSQSPSKTFSLASSASTTFPVGTQLATEHKALRTSTGSDFSQGGESIFGAPTDAFGTMPATFSGSFTELPSLKTTPPAMFGSLSSLPGISDATRLSQLPPAPFDGGLHASISTHAVRPGVTGVEGKVPAAAVRSTSSTALGPPRRPTMQPGGRRPSAATFVAPPPLDLAAACSRPINPATGMPETADEARDRRRTSKKPMQVARLRATFNKYPKFRPPSKPHALPIQGQDGPDRNLHQSAPAAQSTRQPLTRNTESFHRNKSFSLAAIYDHSSASLSSPDNEEVVRCIAVALRYHIKREHGHGSHGGTPPASPSSTGSLDIFDERLHPVSQTVRRDSYWHKAPPLEDVYKYVSTIFNAEKLAPECAILSLAYTERLLETGQVKLHSTNWRRIILSCIILASKVWEDQAVWNVDFVNVFSKLTVADLNRMEKIVLSLLQYNVSLHASLYAKYYFELRDLSDLDDRVFPLQPVDPRRAAAAQTRVESQQRRKGHVRTRSLDAILLPPGPSH